MSEVREGSERADGRERVRREVEAEGSQRAEIERVGRLRLRSSKIEELRGILGGWRMGKVWEEVVEDESTERGGGGGRATVNQVEEEV